MDLNIFQESYEKNTEELKNVLTLSIKNGKLSQRGKENKLLPRDERKMHAFDEQTASIASIIVLCTLCVCTIFGSYVLAEHSSSPKEQ